MSVLRAQLLGSPQVTVEGRSVELGSGRIRAMLCFLLATRQFHSRERLASFFWPDVPEKNALASLRTALYELRRALGDQATVFLVVERGRVGIDPAADIELDVTGLEAIGDACDDLTLEQLEAATSAWRGLFLDGVSVPDAYEFDDWVFLERDRLHQLYIGALCRIGEQHARHGAYDRAIDAARRVLAVDPLREEIHRALMRYLALDGQRAAALAHFRTCEDRLRRELDVEPLASTRQLYESIAAGAAFDAAEDGPSPIARAAANRSRRARRLIIGAEAPFQEHTGVPFVGRGTERGVLRGAWDAASAGHGSLVLVAGEAGIGKTRLLSDLVAGAADRARVLFGRCWESTISEPYGPVLDALRSASPPLDFAALDLAPVWFRELARLLPELEPLVDGEGSGPLDGVRDRDRLFEGVRAALRAMCSDRPLILIVDDIHWADETSLSLLAHVARGAHDMPLLIVATCRDEDFPSARQPLLRALEACGRRLDVRPLGADDAAELIQALSASHVLPERFGARIHQRSGGNPFFLVETLQALFEQRSVERDDEGRWTTSHSSAAADYSALPMPERVGHIVDSRLARLDDDSRSLLECAAVLRRGFGFELVQRLSGLDVHAGLDALDALLMHGLIEEAGEDGLEAQFDFHHALVRERVYGNLSGARRQHLHRQVAGLLEADQTEAPDRIAYHYLRGGVRRRACAWSLRAGDSAMAVYAHEDALSHFRTAAELAATADEELAAQAGAGDAAVGLGRPAEAVGHFRSALEHASSPEVSADLLRRIGRSHERQGAFDDAIVAFEQARTALRGRPVSLESVRIADGLATVYVRLGRIDRARALCHDALTLLEMCDGLEAADHDKAEAWIRNTLGMACLHGDRYAEAIESLTRSLQLKRALNDRLGEATLLNNLGVVHYHAGRDDEAHVRYAESLEIKASIGDLYGLAIAHTNLALIETHLGMLDEAEVHLAAARGAAEDVRATWLQPEIHRIGAQHALARNDVDTARSEAKTALDTAETLGVPAFIGVAYRVLGQVWSRGGDDGDDGDVAGAHFETSLAVFEMLENRHELAKTRAALGASLLDAGRDEAAIPHLQAALEVFQNAGAEGRAERIRAMLEK